MTTKNIFSFLFLLLLSLCIFAQPNTNLGGSGVFSNFFNTNSNTDNEPCFEVLTEAAVKTLRDTGGLQVGCWYNFVVNDLGGGNVALKAVATNVLGEAGYFWSGITGSKAFDAIYDMDSGNLTYLYDSDNDNSFYGETTIVNAYNGGVFGATANINRCKFGQDANVIVRNATGTVQDCVFEECNVLFNDATALDVRDSRFGGESSVNVQGVANVFIDNCSFDNASSVRVQVGGAINMRRSNLNRGLITVLVDSNLRLDDVTMNSNGQIYCREVGTYVLNRCMIASSSYLYFRGSNGGTARYEDCTLTSRGYVYNYRSNPRVRYMVSNGGYHYLFEDAAQYQFNTLNAFGYWRSRRNASTVQILYNVADSYGRFYTYNLTATARFERNNSSSNAYLMMLGGTGRFFGNRVNNRFVLRANLMDNDVYYCYGTTNIVQDLSNMDYLNKGRDPFNNNY